jgi:hypothetical protein
MVSSCLEPQGVWQYYDFDRFSNVSVLFQDCFSQRDGQFRVSWIVVGIPDQKPVGAAGMPPAGKVLMTKVMLVR